MGANISKRYSSYKSQPKMFKLFLNLLHNGPYKIAFGSFEMLKIEFIEIDLFSLTWDPMGVKISKRYSYKSQLKLFKTSQWSS